MSHTYKRITFITRRQHTYKNVYKYTIQTHILTGYTQEFSLTGLTTQERQIKKYILCVKWAIWTLYGKIRSINPMMLFLFLTCDCWARLDMPFRISL